jgi:DNA-3-methyladenine glycosylase I
MSEMRHRCPWAERTELERQYHDTEWGIPTHDDRRLFEFLLLEGAQAGLAWITVLRKREAYRVAFDGFDPERIARYDEAEIATLLANPGLIRNRLKIQSAVTNARAFLQIQAEFGSFDDYVWRHADGPPVTQVWPSLADLPARSPLADRLSKDLQKRGFRFVGPVICYSYLQAVGVVNDHIVGCYRLDET